MKRLILSCLVLLIAACDRAPSTTLQGYGEADYIYLASQEAGVIAELFVREGDAVEAGAPIFRIDADRIDAPLRGASAQGAALEQAVVAARANAALARRTYERSAALRQDGFVSQARLDADRAALEAVNAQVEEARRRLSAANSDTALWRERRSDLAGAAPVAGAIERIFHRPGEMVAAGAPIAALLAPQNMKVRFFAPEAMLSRFPVGSQVAVACDGCADGLTANVSFVATEPQFTPPVIYSLDQREKLVFLVEARFNAPTQVRPGMPVDVRPVAAQ